MAVRLRAPVTRSYKVENPDVQNVRVRSGCVPFERPGSGLLMQDDSDRSTLKETMNPPWQRFIQVALMHH